MQVLISKAIQHSYDKSKVLNLVNALVQRNLKEFAVFEVFHFTHWFEFVGEEQGNRSVSLLKQSLHVN